MVFYHWCISVLIRLGYLGIERRQKLIFALPISVDFAPSRLFRTIESYAIEGVCRRRTYKLLGSC